MYQVMNGRNIAAILNPRPLTIVTVKDAQGANNACTAAWTTPLSHEPPMVALALKHGSRTTQIIRETKQAVLNTLKPEQGDEARLFGTCSGNTVDKHALLEERIHKSHVVAAPSFKDALAHIECELQQELDTGDHVLFVFSVVAAWSSDNLQEDLLYSNNTLLVVQRDDFDIVKGGE